MESPLSSFAGEFLFEVTVLDSNALPILYEEAGGNLPHPHGLVQTTERLLPLTDPNGVTIYLSYFPFDDENTFIVHRNWRDYVARFGLTPGDRILFFRRRHGLGPTHLCTRNVQYPYLPSRRCFSSQNLLFEKEITRFEGIHDFFMVDTRWAMNYFHSVDILPGYEEIVKFTDIVERTWYMTIMYVPEFDLYVLRNGWGLFVRYHSLSPSDVVQIYDPRVRSSMKHFSIHYTRRVLRPL